MDIQYNYKKVLVFFCLQTCYWFRRWCWSSPACPASSSTPGPASPASTSAATGLLQNRLKTDFQHRNHYDNLTRMLSKSNGLRQNSGLPESWFENQNQRWEFKEEKRYCLSLIIIIIAINQLLMIFNIITPFFYKEMVECILNICGAGSCPGYRTDHHWCAVPRTWRYGSVQLPFKGTGHIRIDGRVQLSIKCTEQTINDVQCPEPDGIAQLPIKGTGQIKNYERWSDPVQYVQLPFKAVDLLWTMYNHCPKPVEMNVQNRF